MKRIFLLAAGLAAFIAGPAAAQSNECLRLDRILNWHVVNDRTMIVEDNSHRKFQLDMLGTCPALAWQERIGFKVIGGTELSCVTPGDQILTRGPGSFGPCSIRSIRPLPPGHKGANRPVRENY